jgi:tricorn protease
MTRVVAACAVLLVASALQAQEPIRFARSPAISPDGKLVAFSYLGDLWLVDAKGGEAQHLTMHEKHDFNPIFSPDGKWIAFSSNRHGQYDVFVISVKGGRPKRLTFDSADDHVTGWSPDSQHVLFSSSRLTDYPPRIELFSIPLAGGAAKQISAHEGRDGTYSPRGDMIAYVRGPGLWYRKGYHGSANDDIWICNADGSNNRRITDHQGQDSYPMWHPNGNHLYYVSDCLGGVANIVKLEINGARGELLSEKQEARRVTDHKSDFVRRARMSANGAAIVYECGPDLFIHSIKDGKSRRLSIEVNADDRANPEKLTTFTTGMTEFAYSPNEQHVAFVVHGEIFLMPRTGGKAKRLTDNPGFDHGVAWSPDAKKILFLSDRNGHEDIYLLEPDDPDHTELVLANRFKVKQITNTPEAEVGVSFSPDGSRVAFLRAGRLMTIKPDGSDEKVLVADGQVFDYEWSPDGKWIAYARMDGSFASELFIIPAAGASAKDPARNITRFATYNGGVTWSKSGHTLAFISQRKTTSLSAYVLALQKPAAVGAGSSSDIDWDNIHLRVRQPTSMNVSECAISGDGTKIAFCAASGSSEDLWIASVDGGTVTRLTNDNSKPTQIQWSKSRYYPGQIYFRDAKGNLRAIKIDGTTTVGPVTIPFVAKMTVRQDELFQEMFEQSWRALNENFYDAKFHGVDWQQIRARYRPLVRHCALKEDLYALISLMFGELNASHLGITGDLGTAEQQTAELGLIFERGDAGPGLKIAEIVKDGPADRRGLSLHAGDRIVSIDGTEITDRVNLARLLNDKVGEPIVLHVVPDGGSDKRRLEVRGESRLRVNQLMYQRWIAKNAERVTQMSHGKLGYIHIRSMSEPGLDDFVRALCSDNFDKEGIVLDVRHNGGGFTHDQVLNYLNGKEHTIFSHRNGSSGLVLRSYDRKWTKPLTLLINNRSFSDAEIFPHAFRTWGLGKLVGQATGGFVIGTRELTLIDGSKFRTPRIGVHTIKGVNMEREGVVPDVVVEPSPDALARGRDMQLEKGVEVLTQDVAAWKKSRRPPAAPMVGGN